MRHPPSIPPFFALAAMLLAPGAGGAGRGDLAPVPHPEIGQLGELGRQLEPEIARLDELLARPELEPRQLAEGYGELGRLYLAYELWEAAEVCFTNAARLEARDFRWSYYLGYLHRETGRLERAAELYETARELRRDYAPTHLRLGDVYLQLHRVEKAESLAAALLADTPAAAAPARVLLGKAALARHDYRAAREHFSAVLERHPEARWLHYQLAMAYRGLGDLDEARRQLALQGPGSLPMSDPLIDGLATLTTGASAELRQAMAEVGAGRVDEALARYRRAVASAPERADVRTSYAAMLAQLGDLEAAVDQYREALRLEPGNLLVRYSLGHTLALAGASRPAAYEEAELRLDEVLRLEGDFTDALRRRAQVREARGRADAALADYGRIVELEPWNLDARLDLAGALLRHDHLVAAAEELRAVLARDPAHASATLDLGTTLARLGQVEPAAARLEAVLALAADAETRARAHYNLGLLEAGRGSQDSAAEHFATAVELRPDWSDAHLQNAAALARAGRPAAAAAAYARAVTLVPDNAAAHHGEAMSLAAAGRFSEAMQRLEQGFAKFPQSGTFAHSLARLLAICPDPSLRDGTRALKLATAVVRASQTVEHAETLAMALAEVGRFDEAARIQGEILGVAEEEGVPAAALARMGEALARYQRRERWRLTAEKPTG